MINNPTISIIGGTFWGNRGAEAMLATTIGMIRRDFPDARFVIFSYYPEEDRALVHDEKIIILSGKPVSLVLNHFFGALLGVLFRFLKIQIPKGRSFEVARMLLESDLLLDVGGITFSDGREKYLPFNILTIWPAMILGVPVVKMAQAMGPFKQYINRVCAKIFLNKCFFIFSRGESTTNHLRDLKIDRSKYEESADIAFLYKDSFSLTHENEARVRAITDKLNHYKKNKGKVVAISPSILVEKESMKAGADYIGDILDAIGELSSNVGNHFVVIPNATRKGSRETHNNDLLLINKMKDRFKSGGGDQLRVDWVDFDINTKGIREIIHTADVLVTSRYHAMISGLCLGIPTLVIGWSHKYTETMALFGLEGSSIDFGKEEKNIAGSVVRLMNSKKCFQEKINKKIISVRKKSQIQFDLIKKELQ